MRTVPYTISREEARSFYNRFGSKQDWQKFYEDPATRELIRRGDLENAHSVIEFGCGTGRFAEELLDYHLPRDARYIGLDISETMVDLSRKRLARFGNRVAVQLTDGDVRIQAPDGSADRFISNFVVDLLPLDEVLILMETAARLLSESGLLCLTSLTHGFTLSSTVIERILNVIYNFRPTLLGGCRPVSLIEVVTGTAWRIRHNERFTRFGVATEVLVAERLAVRKEEITQWA